jgi:hypothetical protein
MWCYNKVCIIYFQDFNRYITHVPMPGTDGGFSLLSGLGFQEEHFADMYFTSTFLYIDNFLNEVISM